ncbi:MAG: hypothetical protein N2167_09705 [Flavobacteriales bacterium]|nr:hypothetical protein [Flavobacteriales bacterium]
MKTLLLNFIQAGFYCFFTPVLFVFAGDSTQQMPDPLEGIWNIHVIRSLYYNGQLVSQEKESNIATYAILRNKNNQLEVTYIGVKAKYDTPNSFKAWFCSSSTPDIYLYKCRFKKPVYWEVQTTARLYNNNILEYEYFVHRRFMYFVYGKDYVNAGYQLHWHFYWTRDTSLKT